MIARKPKGLSEEGSKIWDRMARAHDARRSEFDIAREDPRLVMRYNRGSGVAWGVHTATGGKFVWRIAANLPDAKAKTATMKWFLNHHYMRVEEIDIHSTGEFDALTPADLERIDGEDF